MQCLEKNAELFRGDLVFMSINSARAGSSNYQLDYLFNVFLDTGGVGRWNLPQPAVPNPEARYRGWNQKERKKADHNGKYSTRRACGCKARVAAVVLRHTAGRGLTSWDRGGTQLACWLGRGTKGNI